MQEKGFTLVELAIVMTIIGLLIGGVIKGQQLIQNAKIKSQIKQFQSVEVAMTTFRDQYSAMPGDMVNATTRILNCTAANFCMNGNGDGKVGRIGTAFSPTQSAITSLPQVETTMFWKHLVLSNMMSGVIPNANPSTPVWGETHPASPVSGGLQIGFHAIGDGQPDTRLSGHFLMITDTSRGMSYTLTSAEASQIDRTIDDGRPNTGTVLAEAVGNGCKSNDGASGEYVPLTRGQVCIIWYSIGF